MADISITVYEDITAVMPNDEALSTMVGKTGSELFDGEWSWTGYNLEEMIFYITHGMFGYEITFEKPETPYVNSDDFDAYGAVSDLKVVSIKRTPEWDEYTTPEYHGQEIK